MVHRVFPIFTLPVGATRLCCARAANLHTSAPGILQSHPHVFGVWVPTRYRPREVECGRLVSRRRRKTVMLHAPVSQPSALNAGGGLGPNPVVGRSASGCAHLDTCGRGGHVHGQGNAQADALRVQKSPTLRSQKPPEKSRGEGISGPKKAPGIRARNLAHSNMCPHNAGPFSGHGFRPRNSNTRGQFSCSGDGRGPPLYRAVQLLHRKPVIWPWPRPQLTPTTRPSPHPLLAAPVHASGPPRRLSETLPASSTHRPDTQGCHDVRDARSMAPGNMCVRVENVPRDTGMRRASHGRVHDLERGGNDCELVDEWGEQFFPQASKRVRQILSAGASHDHKVLQRAPRPSPTMRTALQPQVLQSVHLRSTAATQQVIIEMPRSWYKTLHAITVRAFLVYIARAIRARAKAKHPPTRRING